MRIIITSLFISIFFAFPAVTKDPLCIEFERLKKYYSKLTPKRLAIIMYYCEKNNINVDYFCGLINEESGWISTAVSKSNARGLSQIIGRYHYRGRNYDDLFDDNLNIKIGTRVLRDYTKIAKKRYGKKYLKESFRLYNAGPFSDRNIYKNWDYVYRILLNVKNTKKIKNIINIR